MDFWILAGFLAVAFLTGGSSRADVQSLVILRPLAAFAAAYALAGLQWPQLRRFPITAALLAFTILIPLLHLIPLPPAIWTGLPGRSLVAEIDETSGLGSIWRPMSMAPAMTRNALYSLIVPLAVLLLAVRLDDRERARLIPTMILFGIFSGILSVLQLLGRPDGPLFFYEQTMNGAAVGPFSNRNHNGVFLACMFPLLTAWVVQRLAQRKGARRIWFAAAVAIVVALLELVIGSRAGLLCAGLAIVISPLLGLDWLRDASAQARRFALWGYLAGVGALGSLAALFIAFSRAEAFSRLIASDMTDNRRIEVWLPALKMTEHYFPFGSGAGSYVPVFQVDEPDSILTWTYSNHVHNDWIEVVLTAGLPGALLLIATVAAVLFLSGRAWTRRQLSPASRLRARMASLVIVLLGLASLGDYPLRTPSLMAFFVVMLLWLEAPASEDAPLVSS